MYRKLLAGALGAAALVSASSASAATYFSYLDWSNTGPGGGVAQTTQANAWGKVTIVENVGYLDITVDLTKAVGFLNTGSKDKANTLGVNESNKDPFTFNANGDYVVTPINTTINGRTQTFFDGGHKDDWFQNNPFGQFDDKIGCCNSAADEKNGSGSASPDPLHFTIAAAGISFAGAGATFDPVTGKLLTYGAGNDPHLLSNSLKYWFAADVTDNFSSGNTFSIAAKDAFRELPPPPPVPEPATWALMIMGFGGAGAMLRRRRHAVA